MSSITCHVTYKAKKKIVEGKSAEEVVSKIQDSFGIVGLSLQKYDQMWEDWVDIQHNEIKDHMKLQVQSTGPTCTAEVEVITTSKPGDVELPTSPVIFTASVLGEASTADSGGTKAETKGDLSSTAMELGEISTVDYGGTKGGASGLGEMTSTADDAGTSKSAPTTVQR